MLKKKNLLLSQQVSAPLWVLQISHWLRALPGAELAHGAPGQGHAPGRGIHDMQMAQQGDAKEGQCVGVTVAVRDLALPFLCGSGCSYPHPQEHWDHSCSARSKQGQRDSSCQPLLSALAAFRPRSCCYLRTQIPIKKMSNSKPRGYGNSSDNSNPKQQTPRACPQLCNPKANATHLTEFLYISTPLGQQH